MPRGSSIRLVDEMTYEEALAELEKIVSTLEEEGNPLDQAMQLYERGQALITRCSKLLEEAQLKVQQLTGDTLNPYEEEGE